MKEKRTMKRSLTIFLVAICLGCPRGAVFGQEGGKNASKGRIANAVQQASSIDGVWTFTGELLQKSCGEPATLQTFTDTFQMDRNKDALYVFALSDSQEFLGELKGGEFTVATPVRSIELNESCTQIAFLAMTGNWRKERATLSIVNTFVGSCPGANDCQFVYEGAFTKVRAKMKRYNNNKKFQSVLRVSPDT